LAAALFVSKRLQHAVLALLLLVSAQLVATALARPAPPPGAVIVPVSR
jgi:hypothetical protein